MKVVSRQLESSKLCAGTVYPQGRQTSLLGAAFIPLRTLSLNNRSRDARRRIVDANYVGTNCNTPRPLKRADPVLDWRSKYRAGDGGGQLLNKRG